MKKRVLRITAVAIMIAAAFAGCDKNNGNKDNGNIKDGDGTNNDASVIEAKNVIDNGGLNEVVMVKAVMWDDNDDVYVELASADFKKNGFKLKLPSTVPNGCLVSSEFVEYASDKNAKWGRLNVGGCDRDGKIIEGFLCVNVTEKYICYAFYVYADRNFTAKFKNEEAEIDCEFKKGWNVYYVYYDRVKEKGKYTTKKPSGVELKWIYDD
jgi:hypothetical protein